VRLHDLFQSVPIRFTDYISHKNNFANIFHIVKARKFTIRKRKTVEGSFEDKTHFQNERNENLILFAERNFTKMELVV